MFSDSVLWAGVDTKGMHVNMLCLCPLNTSPHSCRYVKNIRNNKILVPKTGTDLGPKTGGQKEGYLQSRTCLAAVQQDIHMNW